MYKGSKLTRKSKGKKKKRRRYEDIEKKTQNIQSTKFSKKKGSSKGKYLATPPRIGWMGERNSKDPCLMTWADPNLARGQDFFKCGFKEC